MKAGRILILIFLFISVVVVAQHLFIAWVPELIFMVAKSRSGKPLNSIIHAGRTDAGLRRVVLPNPDFIYSICFYDAGEHDIMVSGDFPDSSQYCSLGFYGKDIQPYYVVNNQTGLKPHFKFRLSTVNRVNSEIKSPDKQGALLLRILVNGEAQRQKALEIQRSLKLKLLSQNE